MVDVLLCRNMVKRNLKKVETYKCSDIWEKYCKSICEFPMSSSDIAVSSRKMIYNLDIDISLVTLMDTGGDSEEREMIEKTYVGTFAS